MSITTIPPIEGYANYLAAICITNGAETSQENPAPLQLLKSLDDLDAEPDEDEDDVDLDEDDDEDEDEDDDLDDEVDEDDEDGDDEDEDDEDEDEEEDEDEVKPLKVTGTARPRRVQ